MPLYFAYGSNMDLGGMRGRCPRSRLLGAARLMRHRFALMGQSGYATVSPDPAAVVHGLLFDLAAADVAALDRYEDVAHGLYRKAVLPVLPAAGGARRALSYLGNETSEGCAPPPGYMEGVVAAARAAALPPAYVGHLATFVPRLAQGALRRVVR